MIRVRYTTIELDLPQKLEGGTGRITICVILHFTSAISQSEGFMEMMIVAGIVRIVCLTT